MEKIKDIRYYTVEFEGNKTYNFPKKIHYIGQRFALKLREFGLHLENYSHVYIFLTPSLPQDEYIVSDRIRENWIKCIDYGYSVDRLNCLNDEELTAEFCKITQNVLIKYCCSNDIQREQVIAAYEEILQCGENTNIVYKSLNSGKDRVYIIVRILDSGQVALYYKINKDSIKFIKNFRNMIEVSQMLGNIKITKNFIRITPKKNSYSEYYNFEDIRINL